MYFFHASLPELYVMKIFFGMCVIHTSVLHMRPSTDVMLVPQLMAAVGIMGLALVVCCALVASAKLQNEESVLYGIGSGEEQEGANAIVTTFETFKDQEEMIEKEVNTSFLQCISVHGGYSVSWPKYCCVMVLAKQTAACTDTKHSQDMLWKYAAQYINLEVCLVDVEHSLAKNMSMYVLSGYMSMRLSKTQGVDLLLQVFDTVPIQVVYLHVSFAAWQRFLQG
jgi:hypothetical protein